MSCGHAFAPVCPSCGAENPPGAKFCIECGTGLAGAPAPAPAQRGRAPTGAPPAGSGAPAAPDHLRPSATLPEERRKATVLFADLSGYTAVSERMDPEDLKAMVDRALQRLGQEVVRFGGTVDKYIGDNVMAVFGAPVAHEDDPERAVRAGLAMQAAMGEINERIVGTAGTEGTEFALRVGINSGEVLAGRMGDGYTVIGDPVNVAARLQSAARPGSVTVGEVTHRLTRNAIEYTELEPLRLKGKSEPVPAWEAVRVSVSGTATAARASTPLIGRTDESQMLASLFDRVVREERPHLVTVIGQAGVGKTRLLRELATHVSERDDSALMRVGHCPAYGSGLAYWALGEVVRDQFQIVDTDDSEIAWSKLSSGFEKLFAEGGAVTDEPPERIAATIARPLGVEVPEDVAAEHLPEGEDPQQTRARLFSAVRSLVEAASRIHPLVLAIEDIHWADEGMLDLLEYLARWLRGPALIVCLARDEILDRRPTWGSGRRNATTIALDPLQPELARELVAALLPEGDEGPSDELVEQVAVRSGGNPLFAEEMINRIMEGGSEALPDTVHAVLAARLDALAPAERQLIQHASVVGNTFWEGSVAGVAEAEGEPVDSILGSLADKDLIVPTAGSRLAGEREFAFKHVLIRDVAYSTLPKSVRARKHAEIGLFIEERAADRSEGVVAMVADHFGRAAAIGADAGIEGEELHRINDRAHAALEAAGDAAAALYSNQEAMTHYEAALGLDGHDGECEHPDARARIAEKLGDIALRLGRVDRAVELWEQCLDYHRGQEDLARVGDLHRKIGAGLWNKGDREGSIGHYQRGIDLLKDGPPCLELVRLYEEAASLYMHTGDNMLAIYASEKALRLAERLEESAAASRAHGIFGRVFGRIGDSERARENLERSVELARDSDPSEAIRALQALGYHFEVSEADYDAAARAYDEALETAERTGDLPSQVELHGALAMLALNRGQWAQVETGTETSAALVEREGLTGKLCFPHLLRGALRWREGDLDGAERSLRRAAELAEQAGRSEVTFQALRWLATALRDRGDHADADQALATALDTCERAGLIAQSVEATAARAVNQALWGHAEQARTLAEEASGLAERLRYPVGSASALEARGAAGEDPATLAEAAAAWRELGRPLDAERVERLSSHA
jgi:class 3 adenylate cyclase/tetratricopeptide (TPR) repeat protein/type II secretory pathway predicted ATPase ExeA